ncbi:hypothetical protein BgiBS90_029081 [Biomphalaria glabrata]|nr:hypothetical protein BgiBS90_029081 [Biomphalaria glabrata]
MSFYNAPLSLRNAAVDSLYCSGDSEWSILTFRSIDSEAQCSLANFTEPLQIRVTPTNSKILAAVQSLT